MKPPKVSVIVPVYNVEKYIERCARSLFEQTLDEIEYIFVNDKTPDRSFEILDSILADYPHRRPQVKIIEMPVNSKQAAARTAGMKAVTGEYQIHCDPDDWVEPKAYELMYAKAIESHADIVTCKASMHKGNSVSVVGYSYSGNGIDCLISKSFDAVLWSKLISSRLININHIYPYTGINNGEDLNIVIRAIYFANHIDYVKKSLYHYNCNNYDSITHSSTRRNIETYAVQNIAQISQFIESVHIPNSQRILNQLKFETKAPLLWGAEISYSDAIYWAGLWQECHCIINNIFLRKFLKYPICAFLYSRYLNRR